MKKIKLVLFIFFLLFVITSYGQQRKNNGFIINGQISGIENDIIIRLVDINGQKIIDSAKLFDGKFILKGKVEEPTSCWLQCKDNYSIIMVENTEMTYSTSFTNMRLDAKITGGGEQKLKNRLTTLQLPYEKLYQEALDSLNNYPKLDKSIKNSLIDKLNYNGEKSQSVYIQFGKDNPNSYVGLDIIYRNRKTIGKDSIEILYNKLGKKLKNTGKAAALKIFFSETLAQKGKRFIDFDANAINGEKFKLSYLKGKYILLSFGSAGCVFSSELNKVINKNYDKLKDKIHFINFSVDRNKQGWIDASKRYNIVWTNVSDLKGENSSIKARYNVQSVPTSFIIDKNGIIVDIFNGFSDEKYFLDELEKIINPEFHK